MQALYRRFGIAGGHLPESPGPSKRKLYIRDLAYQGDTPLNPPVRANASFYIRDLAYQGDAPLNPPARANASFISKIWHIRVTHNLTPQSKQKIEYRLMIR